MDYWLYLQRFPFITGLWCSVEYQPVWRWSRVCHFRFTKVYRRDSDGLARSCYVQRCRHITSLTLIHNLGCFEEKFFISQGVWNSHVQCWKNIDMTSLLTLSSIYTHFNTLKKKALEKH